MRFLQSPARQHCRELPPIRRGYVHVFHYFELAAGLSCFTE
jgi:hypothetical protein